MVYLLYVLGIFRNRYRRVVERVTVDCPIATTPFEVQSSPIPLLRPANQRRYSSCNSVSASPYCTTRRDPSVRSSSRHSDSQAFTEHVRAPSPPRLPTARLDNAPRMFEQACLPTPGGDRSQDASRTSSDHSVASGYLPWSFRVALPLRGRDSEVHK